jgi:hypothetical protein
MSQKNATKVIKRSIYLRICDDLANRTKHAVLTRDWNDSDTSPTQLKADVHGGSRAPHRWEITAGDAVYDAFDLALNCVAAWERVLTDRGLLDAR